MLTSHGKLELGIGQLQVADFLERRFWLHLVLRHNMAFDTRVSMPSAERDTVKLYAVVEGEVSTSKGPIAAPVAWLMKSNDFSTQGSDFLRIAGACCRIVDLQLLRDDVCLPVGIEHGPIRMSDAAWQAAAALVADPLQTAATTSGVRQLVDELVACGVVAASLPASIVEDQASEFQRIADAMRPLISDVNLNVTAAQLAESAGISPRTFTRLFGEFTSTFGMIGDGFRDSIIRVRLRTAVILLSIPGVTSTMVSQRLGYGSLSALALALREAGLPPPQKIVELLRGAAEASAEPAE